MKRLVGNLLWGLIVVSVSIHAAPPPGQAPRTVSLESTASDTGLIPLIPASQLRQLAVHNAGYWTVPISCAGFPPYGNYNGTYRDPETNQTAGYAGFPTGTSNQYIFSGGIWVGGIVNGDTLVSASYDNYYTGIYEFWPPDPAAGGVRRTGDFANDEFTAVFTDTVTAPYVTYSNPFDDTTHIPMGIKLTQRSYSWSDSLYDNFVIFEYAIENIRDTYIADGWFGVIVDADVYVGTGIYSALGYADDVSGVLDTFLYDGDSSSRVIIPYSYDMDGDPGQDGGWDANSVSGVVSLALLEAPVSDPICNFNWWITDANSTRDFGGRRVGTPDDPFRPFAGGFLGTPQRQQDKYYVMAHPELDYNQIEMDAHDSTDGWVPCDRKLLQITNDTKFLYSFGPFDLPPHDTVVVAFAIVGSDRFHVDPDDFDDYFDPESPQAFENRLDFSQLMINHRRADSVYRSGLQLPTPGPPVGLQVLDYSDSQVTLYWNKSHYPSAAGYYVNVRDTVYDNIWRRTHLLPLQDTMYVFSVSSPSHLYQFAVTLIDQQGRESDYSFEAQSIPATPLPPQNPAIKMDGNIPEISWDPPDDDGLFVYMIYRAAWREVYQLYDSVSALSYRDYGAESGVWYNYKVAAKNDLQLESTLAGPVSALPMALDKKVLFYDMNYDYSVHVDAYHKRYVDRLVYAVQPQVSMDYYDVEDGFLPFKKMADYSVIVFDSEMRGGKFRDQAIDSIRNYLIHGGKAVFIIPNASSRDIGIAPYTSIYSQGSFFHDYIHLDSAVTNGIVLSGGQIRGDLMGCRSVTSGYPDLTADSAKLAAAPLPIEGYLPLAGYISPMDDVEPLYRYQSLYPDSTYHEKIDGIRYLSDTGSFILFNFPLSLMNEPDNIIAFRQALTDLGLNLNCGDINDNRQLDVGDVASLVGYLFRSGPEPPDPDRADVNCDGLIDLGDAQLMVNALFLGGVGLNCCR